MAEAEKKEEKVIRVEFTPKEAIIVHMLYYVGAAFINRDFQECQSLARSSDNFVCEKMSTEEINALKAKMTKLAEDIPPEDLKEMEIHLTKAP